MTVSPHVLMVCLGNICRSPTAEVALRAAAEKRGIHMTVSSAGTGDWHQGHPADPRMRDAAASFALDLSHHTARQVDVAMMREADLILAMDRLNYLELNRIATERHITTPIRLFRDFDPKAGTERDVPDPYYGNGEGFTNVVAMCVRTADHLLDAVSLNRVAGVRLIEDPS
jgi:protein-tyrosine phosphatase